MVGHDVQTSVPRIIDENVDSRWRVGTRLVIGHTLGRLQSRMRPSFLIIGAPKAGSTALFKYMELHPQIVAPQVKEIQFFDHRYWLGEPWYATYFPPRTHGDDRTTFEATANYVYHPACAARIHAYDPSIKLIAVLRNPIDRAYSNWNWRIGLGWHNFGYETFDAMVRGEIDAIARNGTGYPGNTAPKYLQRGLYAEQLEPYFALFPGEQIRVIDSTALRRDTVNTLNAVTRWLGLRDHDWAGKHLTPANESRSAEPLRDETRAALAEFYRPHNERLYALLGVDYGWNP
jgi:hypothetical protein